MNRKVKVPDATIVVTDLDGCPNLSFGDPTTNRSGRRHRICVQVLNEVNFWLAKFGILAEPIPIPSVADYHDKVRGGSNLDILPLELREADTPAARIVRAVLPAWFDARLKKYLREDLDYDFVPPENLEALLAIDRLCSFSVVSYRNQTSEAFLAECKRLGIVGPGALKVHNVNAIGIKGASSAEAKSDFLRWWYGHPIHVQRERGQRPISIGDSVMDLRASRIVGFDTFFAITGTGEDTEASFAKEIDSCRRVYGDDRINICMFPSFGDPQLLAALKEIVAVGPTR